MEYQENDELYKVFKKELELGEARRREIEGELANFKNKSPKTGIQLKLAKKEIKTHETKEGYVSDSF